VVLDGSHLKVSRSKMCISLAARGPVPSHPPMMNSLFSISDDYVCLKDLTYESCCMTITALRLSAKRLLRFHPLIFLGVKDPESRVVLLAIIAAKHVQFAIVEGRGVILDLRRVLDGNRLLWHHAVVLITSAGQLLLVVLWFRNQSPGQLGLLASVAKVFSLVIARLLGTVGTFPVLSPL
jgi:hypothetical protein